MKIGGLGLVSELCDHLRVILGGIMLKNDFSLNDFMLNDDFRMDYFKVKNDSRQNDDLRLNDDFKMDYFMVKGDFQAE